MSAEAADGLPNGKRSCTSAMIQLLLYFHIISLLLTDYFNVRYDCAFVFQRCQEGCYHLQVLKVLPFVHLGETQGEVTLLAVVSTGGQIVLLYLARQLQPARIARRTTRDTPRLANSLGNTHRR